MFVLFVAQLWKQIDGKLENKNGHWMYMEETWILPYENETKKGQTIRNWLGRALGKVLKVDIRKQGEHSYSRGMNLKLKNENGYPCI